MRACRSRWRGGSCRSRRRRRARGPRPGRRIPGFPAVRGPSRRETRPCPRSYPSRVLLWGNPACLSSRRRLDSARLAFSFSNRLARKPSWPGVASSRAFSSTLCVNGRLRARPMTCSGVALSRTRPPRCRGFCWLIRPPSCICRNASNPARLRFPHPRGCVWHMCRSPRGRRSVPR